MKIRFKNLVMRFTLLAMLFHRDIKPGQVYIFRSHIKRKNPFENEDKPHTVEILEVRGCWIRYKFIGSSVWNNESMKRDSFNFCYMLEDA